ncbi:MAG: alginate export family protein [Bdellovibrionia bacterium]
MNFALRVVVSIATLLVLASVASASTFEWKGGYRVEWVNLEKPSLANTGSSKSYVLNHLYLSPQLIAADGFNIVARFDMLSANQNSENSQLGVIWGNTNAPTGMSAKADPQTSGSEQFKLTQMYLKLDQEYGQIILGRAPFEFGLGMTYSAGTGLFDHWYSVRDIAAYKFVINDWFIMPIFSRAGDNSVVTGGGMNSMGFQLQYENPDTKSLIGFLQETRKGTAGSNDLNSQFAGSTVNGSFDIQRTNFIFGRGFEKFDFKVEAGFLTGSTGLQNAGNEDIDLNAYGFVVEMDYAQPESKWKWSAKLGMASGDDAETANYEGFQFNPNYNVGMLLFNQRLGQADFLTSGITKNPNIASIKDAFDDENVSNTIFVAPSATYQWKEKTDIRTTLVYAQILNSQANSLSSAKDLGLELDVEFIYKPTKSLQWINQVGLLMPGNAWQYGPNGAEFDKDMTYGFVSKAAISF